MSVEVDDPGGIGGTGGEGQPPTPGTPCVETAIAPVPASVQLTEHFANTELGVVGASEQVVANAVYLCQQLLEPIRAQFGPVNVHDGYRPPAHNAAVGGKPTSYHLYDGTQSAADIDVLPTDYQVVFDWIRLESGLPFDKVILETNEANVPACVHLQIDSAVAPRRQAYVGKTGAGTVYTPVTVS